MTAHHAGQPVPVGSAPAPGGDGRLYSWDDAPVDGVRANRADRTGLAYSAIDSGFCCAQTVLNHRIHLPIAALGVIWGTPVPTRTPISPTATIRPTDTRSLTPSPTVPPGPTPDLCAPVGGTFDATPINGSPSDRPAEAHPDLNLALRGFTPSTAPAALVDYGGETDGRAPKLVGLLGRLPHFSSTHQVFHWDWQADRRAGPITEWPVTLLGLATTPAEPVRVPDSGYGIGQGFMVLVLFANDDQVVLKYTRDDNVVRGYTIHLDGVCVDPVLRALYEQRNREGRGELPGLRAGQAFARARGPEIRVAIRDTGRFMDPRSRKDWWPGLGLTLLGPERPMWLHAGGTEGEEDDGK